MNFAIAITVAVMGCSSVLQGCGGGGDTATTTPAPTPAQAPSCDDKGLKACNSQYAADKKVDKCKASMDYQACNQKPIKPCTVDVKAATALEEAQLLIQNCETDAARKASDDVAADKVKADQAAEDKIIADKEAEDLKTEKFFAAAKAAKAALDKATSDLKADREAAEQAGACMALEQCTGSFQAATIQAGPGTKPCAAMEDYVGCITPGLEACFNPNITAQFGALKDQMATTVALQCAQQAASTSPAPTPFTTPDIVVPSPAPTPFTAPKAAEVVV